MRRAVLVPPLALALLAAAPARAQLGIDLSEPSPPPAQKPTPPEQRPRRDEKPREPVRRLPRKDAEPRRDAPVASPVAPPATAPGSPPPAAPRPAARAPAVPLTAATKARLTAAGALLGRRPEEAALAFDAIARDPAAADGHADARLGVADALGRLGLVRSAIVTAGDVLATAPAEAARRAAGLLFDLSSRTGDDQAVLAQVPRLEGAPLDPGDEDRLHYLLAKYAYERAHALEEAGRRDEASRGYADAQRLAATVKGQGSGARGDVFARARFLDGLARYAEGNGEGALAAFKEVVRLTNPRHVAAADERLRELAFLQLARLHYEHRQNRYALFYYARMPQGGASWLESVWESAYAYYRIGDSERALGNLLTLHSPYFQDEWFPESHLLKAIIYYENCRYPEARAIVDDFERRFTPVHEALVRTVARDEAPPAFYATALSGGREADPAVARRIAKLALADGNVRRLSTSVSELEREAGAGLARRGAAFRGSQLARELRERLDGERARLEAEAGARARGQLDHERASLKDLLTQALRIKIEVSRREREGLEAQIASRGGPAVLREYRYSAAVSDEHLYWPYDGEFWRDELGTYAYTLTKGCRAEPGGDDRRANPGAAPEDVRAAR